jgi:hypothetical protein
LRDIRLGRVRQEVHALDGDQVLVVGTRAEREGRLSGDLVVVIDEDFGGVAILNAQRQRRREAGRETGKTGEKGETHGR